MKSPAFVKRHALQLMALFMFAQCLLMGWLAADTRALARLVGWHDWLVHFKAWCVLIMLLGLLLQFPFLFYLLYREMEKEQHHPGET